MSGTYITSSMNYRRRFFAGVSDVTPAALLLLLAFSIMLLGGEVVTLSLLIDRVDLRWLPTILLLDAVWRFYTFSYLALVYEALQVALEDGPPMSAPCDIEEMI